MADSIFDEKRKYNPEPCLNGQVGANLNYMCGGFAVQKEEEAQAKSRYNSRTVEILERPKTQREIDEAKIAEEFSL